jgi:hypothetical protein
LGKSENHLKEEYLRAAIDNIIEGIVAFNEDCLV